MSAAVLAATETMSDTERWLFMLNLGRQAIGDPAVRADIAGIAARFRGG